MKDTLFVGLDVHKETISVATAKWDRNEAEPMGTILNAPEAAAKLLRRFGRPVDQLHFCYEAGPCGYALYRQLIKAGAKCDVVAPSLIPQKPGDRVKTDRRDAQKLARNLRNGELTPVWVPDEKQEALRDLSRAREDAKEDLRIKKQQVLSLLLRHDLRPPQGVTNWTQKHRQWLDGLKFPDAMQRIVLEEYLRGIQCLLGIQCLRGVAGITAATMVAELGELTRFHAAKQAMDATGMVPTEHSSGPNQRRGSITKSGNAHARAVLIEAAWHYQHQPHMGQNLRRRQEEQPDEVRRIAWKAQHRLHKKYCRMVGRGKPKQVAVVAIARELVGFMWAIAQEVARQQRMRQVA